MVSRKSTNFNTQKFLDLGSKSPDLRKGLSVQPHLAKCESLVACNNLFKKIKNQNSGKIMKI